MKSSLHVIVIWSVMLICIFFFFSSRRRHTRCSRDWSSDVCSSDLSRPTCSWCKSSCREGTSALTSKAKQVLCCGCRSEEHTSELQSRLHLVCRLLLEKKKNHMLAIEQR